ncbi:MAG: MmcQ/YjbR family DNA-binding protein, partial [Acidimicrobiales bacterium]
ASDEGTYFTEPHYNGFPAVLVRLSVIGEDELRELITDAWRCQAPKALVAEFEQNLSGPNT